MRLQFINVEWGINMANDTWRTPTEIINFIENKFGKIQIDLCSSDETKVCDLNLTEENNFLNNYWIDKNLINKFQVFSNFLA